MGRFKHQSLAAVLAVFVTAPACRPASSVGSPSSMNPADNIRRIGSEKGARPPIGLQLYSFREMAKTDPVGMLRLVRSMGISHVETAGLYGMTAERFAEALRSAGLRATSMHADYNDLENHPDVVIANARALGAAYVGLAWYPHNGAFTESDARKAIADFNQFGRTLKNAGITFFYHDHGYEPVPYGDGTLLDLIIRETDPSLVKFEMDALWTWLPGVDPVALIRKYPGRFRLMHIKDMKPGISRGSLAAGLPAEQQAAIGEGQINWPAVIEAAQKDGVEYYYLEDETPDPMVNVPKSIAYLERIKY